MSDARSDLAVIIPTLNAEAGLAATLAALPPVAQRIGVEGGSTDGTVVVARAAGAQVLQSPPGRGVQLAAGAAAAKARWLL
ncbi:MAG: glycosyl transferase family 2, partial [Phenylobacterium sp.]|nr:glycosyl transferase family 2 [Phenylobacterium sp.]